MKSSAYLALAAATVANAHYTYPRAVINGSPSADWEYVRRTENYQTNGPVTDVMSESMTCYELDSSAPGTASVQAGSTFTFGLNTGIFHPGPLSYYLAKAPSTAASFDGKGPVWFKIAEDQPLGLGSSLSWPADGKTEVSVTIPSCVEDGEYLLRVEHIALHGASGLNGAQLYIACAQIGVSGGTGTLNTGTKVSFPGAYSATDPGIQINIYWPVPTSYQNPGPAPVTC